MFRRLTIATFTILVLLAATAPAIADTPRAAWIKAKCALCHGEDGASETPAGKQTKAPDLRTAEFQKLSDGQVTKLIVDGHSKMPAFKALRDDQVNLLLFYIRSIKAAPKK